MYSSDNLKQDLLLNINNTPNSKLYSALLDCEFQFNDSGEFTKIIWNTFKRDLVIFCPIENKDILENEKSMLFQLCDTIHSQKDDFLLMSLEIIAKSDLSKTKLTDSIIQIKNNIVIDRIPENEIGKGGFAKIYKHYDETTEEIYAYKIYAPSVFQESTPEIMKKRFIREGKKLLHYSHENVVKAYDFGFLGDESAYIKQEYINGDKLIDYLHNNDLDVGEKEKLCTQYISAMAYIHGKSDMHRDISYSNVMIDNSGNIKVLDFGFAKGKDDSTYDTYYKDIVHKFALPNENYNLQTEVYCIGAILFSIVTKGIFDRNNLHSLDTCKCNIRLINIIRKCLLENQEERFSNATEIETYLFSGQKYITTSIEIVPTLSLDSFKSMINEIDMYFYTMPTFETIKSWLENDLKDILESSTFVSTVSLITCVRKLPHLEDVGKSDTFDYVYDKSILENIYNFYNQSQEKIKSIIVKNILSIILETSYKSKGLPFNFN